MVGTLISVVQAHRAPVTALTFDSRGDLYSGDRRGWIALWDRWGCRYRHRLSRRGITCIVEGAHETLFAGTFAGEVVRIGWAGMALFPETVAHFRRGVSSLAAAPRRLFAASFRGDLCSIPIEPEDRLERMCDRREGRGAAFVRYDELRRLVLVYGVGTEIEERTAPGIDAIRVHTVPDFTLYDVFPLAGGLVATTGYDHTLRMWHGETWTQLGRVDTRLHGPLSICGGAGKLLFVASPGALIVIDAGRLVIRERIESADLTSVALSGDGCRIAIGYRDGRVGTWDIEGEHGGEFIR